MAEGERISPLAFIMGWLGAARWSTSRLFTRVETAGRESMEAGQAESLPAAVCIDVPLTSCMAWHPGIIDTFFLSPSVSLPFSKVVVDGCTSGTRAVERVASFLPDSPAGQHQARLSTPPSLFPQIPTLDITVPRKTYTVPLWVYPQPSHSRLASIRCRAGGDEVTLAFSLHHFLSRPDNSDSGLLAADSAPGRIQAGWVP